MRLCSRRSSLLIAALVVAILFTAVGVGAAENGASGAGSPRQLDAAEIEALEQMESRLRTLKQNAEVLFGPAALEVREAAFQNLVALRSAAPYLRSSVSQIFYELRRSGEPTLAAAAESVLALIENRAPDASLLEKAGRAPLGGAPFPDVPTKYLQQLADPNPEIRLGSLAIVMEIAVSQRLQVDTATIAALRALLDDPDPRVAYRAEFALRALAGDEAAVGLVYVRPEDDL